jgi:hypothetical protein
MSVSTNAIIAYGIEVEEESLGEVATAWMDEYAGIPSEVTTEFELITHCSGEYPMYILAISGTREEASRGYPEVITIDCSSVRLDWSAKLREFAEEHGIEVSGNPSWKLFSYWG